MVNLLHKGEVDTGPVKSKHIKGKLCVCVCVCVCMFVLNRTYLNVVGMGSNFLGVPRGTPRWFSTDQMLKKLILKIQGFF